MSEKDDDSTTLATEGRTKSWSELFYDFTQDTTFHGVRFITAATPYILRRFVWGSLTLTAFIIFFMFFHERLEYLKTNPKAVDVEVFYTDKIDFPAVTICNQNLFRTSASHHMGLHDYVEESFRDLQNGPKEEPADGVYPDTASEGFEGYHDSTLSGMGRPLATYVDVTAQVCRHLCVKLHSDSCCSIIYQRSRRTCYITPMDENSDGAEKIKAVGVDFFHRRMCQVQTEAGSTFEEGLEKFMVDSTKTLSWKRFQRDERAAGKYPTFDHTLTSASGWYLLATTKFHEPNSVAHFVSPYILSGKDTCISLFYIIRSGILNILTRTQNDVEFRIWSAGRSDTSRWEKGSTQLPQGYFRLVIEASSGKETSAMNVAVDDVYIGPCIRDKTCTETKSGQGFLGVQSESEQKKTCMTWSGLPNRINNMIWTKEEQTVIRNSLKSWKNYCRNPDGDENGPWCVTDVHSEKREYCKINFCGCRDTEFTCDNGMCMSRDNLCNGINDCGDFSDELEPCNVTTSLTCDFNDIHQCGYQSEKSNGHLTWSTGILETSAGQDSSMILDTSEVRAGDRGTLISPEVTNLEETCLRFDYFIETGARLEILLRRLTDSSETKSSGKSTAYPRMQHDVLCYLHGQDYAEWNTTHILLPPGDFRLVFIGVIYYDSAVLAIDNVEMLNENCSQFDVITTESYDIMTTAQSWNATTTEMPGNFSLEASNVTNDLDSTTELYTSTMLYNMTTLQMTTVPPPIPQYFCEPPPSDLTCAGCPRFFKGDGTCKQEFELVHVAIEGFSSSCGESYGQIRIPPDTDPLEGCIKFAEEYGANVFNRRGHTCHIRVCDLEDGLKLTTKHIDGADIYIKEGPSEPVGMSCSFDDECACGYSFLSSNEHDIWKRKERVVIKEVATLDEEPGSGNNSSPEPAWEPGNLFDTSWRWGTTEEAMTEEEEMPKWYMHMNTTGQPQAGDWMRLQSPVQHVRVNSCLRFEYITIYVNINVYINWKKKKGEIKTDKELIFSIRHDGKEGVFHRAAVGVPPGRYAIQFEGIFQDHTVPENAAIDNVNLTEGSCYTEVAAQSINCTFDDDDYCGYQDISPGISRWIRSKKFSDGTPGLYYLRVSQHLPGKSHASVISPRYRTDNISCVSFYYYMQTNNNDLVGTFAVTVVNTTGVNETVLRVRNGVDNTYHYAQFQLEPGEFQLLFEINGDKTRGGLDHILLTPGECKEYNCSSETEFTCTKGNTQVCIHQKYTCDGFNNCDDGDDEADHLCKITQGNETSGDLSWNDNLVKTEVEKMSFTLTGEGDVIETNLTTIYMKAAHQGEDFIYRCRWEGMPCYASNFTKTITDYGVCYAFNTIGEMMQTANTGSRFGLSLTMNIEQYEYMLGPQSDAGVKVFLHEREELAQIRDLGFAISPGTHALVGVRYNQALNLEAPWGDCAEKPLNFTDQYYLSHCERECETSMVVSQCGCRDAYMPGYSLDNPPICDLSMYFECALPTVNSVMDVGSCSCPKPCKQSTYEPGLSSASLSALSVDTILSEGMDELMKNYHATIEAKQRIDKDTFEYDLRTLSAVNTMYTDLLRFAESYLGDFEESSLAKISLATTTLVENVFRHDIDVLFNDLNNYYQSYQRRFADTSLLLDTNLQETKLCLIEILQFYNTDSNAKSTVSHEISIKEQCRMNIYLTEQNLKRYSLESEGEGYLPETLYINTELCIKYIDIFSSAMSSISYLLDGSKALDVASETEVKQWIKNNITTFNSKFTNVNKCIKEYSQVLGQTNTWNKESMKEEAGFVTNDIFVNENYVYTEESEYLVNDQLSVAELYNKYVLDSISKLEVLYHFKPDDSSSESLSNIDNFVERIRSRLTSPLRQRIKGVKKQLAEGYLTALGHATELERYLQPMTFYEKSAKMMIWGVPIANLDDPTRYGTEGREHWKVWNRDLSLEEFTSDIAQEYISEGLAAYCDPLLKILDEFEEQLLLNKQRLLTALNLMTAAHAEYAQLRIIDHKFVLENFLTMDVYFAQLKHQAVKQIKAYETTQFMGDVGGFMGLLLGGSVLTVLELADLILFNFAKKFLGTKEQPKDDDDGSSKDGLDSIDDLEKGNMQKNGTQIEPSDPIDMKKRKPPAKIPPDGKPGK